MFVKSFFQQKCSLLNSTRFFTISDQLINNSYFVSCRNFLRFLVLKYTILFKFRFDCCNPVEELLLVRKDTLVIVFKFDFINVYTIYKCLTRKWVLAWNLRKRRNSRLRPNALKLTTVKTTVIKIELSIFSSFTSWLDYSPRLLSYPSFVVWVAN